MPKRCQIIKLISNVKKSNSQTKEEIHKKKIDNNDDVNFDVTYESHQIWLKTYFMSFLMILMTIKCDIKIDFIVWTSFC